jgi:acyl dehydratase
MTIWWEDLEIGHVIETGTRSVSEDEIINFATEFDPQYFHIDRERAKQSIYGGVIASGWHTCSLAMSLIVPAIRGQAGLGSPGFDNLRWLKPLRPGDTIRVRMTVTERSASRSRTDIGSAKVHSEMFNQHDELVMTMDNIGIYRRRPAP